MKRTLGFHYDMCKAVFGADSPATQWLAGLITESIAGRDEEVVADESQVVYLCGQLHFRHIGDKAFPETAEQMPKSFDEGIKMIEAMLKDGAA